MNKNNIETCRNWKINKVYFHPIQGNLTEKLLLNHRVVQYTNDVNFFYNNIKRCKISLHLLVKQISWIRVRIQSFSRIHYVKSSGYQSYKIFP